LINYIIVILINELSVYPFEVCYFSQAVRNSKIRQMTILITITIKEDPIYKPFYQITC
jgi:hypothetical protein